MSLHYGNLFKGWEVAVAKKLIREFKHKWRCLDTESTEDLLQECLTHWHFNRNKYDPKKDASQKTFMSKVVTIKLVQIVRRNSTDKRKVSYLATPLKEDEEKEEPALEKHAVKIRRDAAGLFLKSQLKIDLAGVIQRLTPRQRIICHLIGEEDLTVKETSRRLKITRKTIQRELKRIKEVFISEGLKDYLE